MGFSYGVARSIITGCVGALHFLKEPEAVSMVTLLSAVDTAVEVGRETLASHRGSSPSNDKFKGGGKNLDDVYQSSKAAILRSSLFSVPHSKTVARRDDSADCLRKLYANLEATELEVAVRNALVSSISSLCA